jgi:hypothetical protein
VTWSLVLSVQMRLPQTLVLLKVLDGFDLYRIRGFHSAQDFHGLMIVFGSVSIFPPSEDLNLWTRVSWICQSSILCICEGDICLCENK